MEWKRFRSAPPLALALILAGLPALSAEDPPRASSGGLEVKHIDAADRATVEQPATRSAAPSAAPASKKPAQESTTWKKSKLVPFPEDEPQAVAASAPKPVAKVAESAPRGTFQPRFRPPGVKPAPAGVKQDSSVKPVQHVEPASKDNTTDKTDAAEGDNGKPSGKALVEVPADGAEQDAEPADDGDTSAAPLDAQAGRAIVDEAFAKSKTAATDAEFTEVIDGCRRGLHAELSPGYEQYARRLMGWAYNRRGEERAKVGSDKEALADFEAAVEASGAWRAIHNRGVSYAALGRYQQALVDFNRTIELNDRYPNAYFNRGELKYQQGDFAGAVEDYSHALQIGTPDATMFNSRGHALYRLERFGEALHDYGEAIKLDPENSAALINRADVYSDLGQYGDAARDYRTAVKLSPNLGRAYQSTAWFMATCPDQHYRNDELAIDAARKAIELDGPTYRNLSTLAAAQASAGKFNDAERTQEQAIAKATQSEKVTAEKMMALYRRDVAYRETPRTAFELPEDEQEKTVLQASKEMLRRPAANRYPVRQAGATAPVGPPRSAPKGRPNPRSR